MLHGVGRHPMHLQHCQRHSRQKRSATFIVSSFFPLVSLKIFKQLNPCRKWLHSKDTRVYRRKLSIKFNWKNWRSIHFINNVEGFVKTKSNINRRFSFVWLSYSIRCYSKVLLKCSMFYKFYQFNPSFQDWKKKREMTWSWI